jgi:hypothetical protein
MISKNKENLANDFEALGEGERGPGEVGRNPYTREKSQPRTVDDYLQLDAQFLAQEGVFAPGKACVVKWADASVGITRVAEGCELRYTAIDDQGSSQICTVIKLEGTVCNYGGRRWWFRCPGDQCGGRRVRLLYCEEREFRCRVCHHLIYPTQYQARWQRWRSKAQNIRVKLGGSRILVDPFPDRPKGMYYRTYRRLRLKESEAAEASFKEMLKSLRGGR